MLDEIENPTSLKSSQEILTQKIFIDILQACTLLPLEVIQHIVLEYHILIAAAPTREYFAKIQKDYKRSLANKESFIFDFSNLDLKAYEFSIKFCYFRDNWGYNSRNEFSVSVNNCIEITYVSRGDLNTLFPRFNFSGSNLRKCEFDLDPAYTLSADFANFSGANLEEAQINYEQDHLFYGNFSDSNLKNCTFRGLNVLADSNFWGAEITGLKFTSVNPGLNPLEFPNKIRDVSFINTTIDDRQLTELAKQNQNQHIYRYSSKKDFDIHRSLMPWLESVSFPSFITGPCFLAGFFPQERLKTPLLGLPHLRVDVVIGCGLLLLGLVCAAVLYWQHRKYICDFPDENQQNLSAESSGDSLFSSSSKIGCRSSNQQSGYYPAPFSN